MAQISLRGINKIYPNGTHAVRDVDLDIADGEFMIMVGPSGCAKSTILRMIAGLEIPSSGSVEIGGRVVNEVAPKDRDIAMVFQSYALYPHMTVRDNMAFGLRLRKMPEQEIQARVSEAARILGLEQLLDRLPKQMSGGQRQRVAMGRAIVREPQAFLMDEPLSNLDAKLRVQMRTEIAKLHQRLQTTTVYVTHDQVEAMTLGQRICILRTGVVQQVDTPFMVYHNPANVFVAGFIGSPGMNFMRGSLAPTTTGVQLTIGASTFELPANVSSRLLGLPGPAGTPVLVGIRPEHLHVSTPGIATLTAHVDLVETLGSEAYAYLSLDGIEMPDLSSLSDTQATASTFVARMASHQNPSQGSLVHLAPDLQHIHLFDPASQATLLGPAHDFSEAIVVQRPHATTAHSERVISSHELPDVRPAAEAYRAHSPGAMTPPSAPPQPPMAPAPGMAPTPALAPTPGMIPATGMAPTPALAPTPGMIPATGMAPTPALAPTPGMIPATGMAPTPGMPARRTQPVAGSDQPPRARIVSEAARAELGEIDPALRIRRSRGASATPRTVFQRHSQEPGVTSADHHTPAHSPTKHDEPAMTLVSHDTPGRPPAIHYEPAMTLVSHDMPSLTGHTSKLFRNQPLFGRSKASD